MTARRVLITGGAGFVGSHLARRLLAEGGHELTLVDDFSRGRNDAELDALARSPDVRLVTGDLTLPATWQGLGGGFDDVYHLAAIIGVKNVLSRSHDVVRVNALTTLHMLDWFVAGGGRKVLFSSTSEAYAWTQQVLTLPIPTPEAVPLALTDLANPRSSYAGSKIFGELAVTQICQAHAKPFAIVRYHNVYGPRMGNEHVIPELFQRARAGEDPLVVYSAHHQRAFCYVDDAVEGTIAAMRLDAADGQTINLGNDRAEITMRDLAAKILARAKHGGAQAEKPAANDPIARRCPDLTRARELLGYEPRVDIDRGLDLTLAWYGAQPAPR